MNYTDEQIKIAKILVHWMYNQGHVKTKDQARIETAKLLKRYPLKSIKKAMNSATDLNKLKKTLIGKNYFNSEINPKT